MKNHLVPGELTLPRASILNRFRAPACQILLCLLLIFACSLHAADTVYVGVDYGLLRSTDAGATWNMVDVPLNTQFMKGFVRPEFLAMDPQNTSKIYFIGSAGGTSFFASADAGATWTVTPFIGLQPTHLRVDFAGQVIYISANDTQNKPSMYKSTNTGASWTQLTLPGTQQEPSGSSVNNIFADPAVSGTVYFESANGNHFFKSKDFGSTWTEIVQTAFKKPSYVDPHNPLIWYDVTGGSVDSALFKSTDGAASFTQINIPSDEVTSVGVGAVSSTLYATGDVKGLGGTVLKSTDGGASWTALQNGMFGTYTGVVWADPVDSSFVFVNDFIYSRSFYVSTDGGAHFNPSMLPQGPPGCVPGNCSTPEITDLVFAVSIPVPPVITSVVNGASFKPGVVANSWVTIQGSGLAPKTDDWSNFIVNGVLPTTVDGVSVSMGGKPAYVYFLSSGQLNVLAPDVPAGPISVTVTTPGGTSANFATTASVYDPAFFVWPGNQAVATRTDYSFAAKPGTFAGATTVAAKPGETLILWATGFGPTTPAAPGGAAVPSDQTYATATLPSVSIGNIPATVAGAALASGSAGLYQIAIQVPGSLTDGDWPILAMIGGVTSPAGTILTVQH
ncbi:MAG TPA: IPT/TIG domain-containing protein [Bryobacteraceae bacterium]|nr:IPT/TIG domain-containing protein [Bryobacteraceae bacterium]